MRAMTERNLRAVDLNLLVVFDALMTEHSVTRAAERNGLSQPAVSKALGRLRFLFGDPLFVRHDRAMVPTQRAKSLAGPIHTALRDISRTLTAPAFDPLRVEARLHVASIDVYHTPLLAVLLRRLRQEAPGVDLHVHALDIGTVRSQLASGEIALAFSPVDAQAAGFHALPLWKDRLVTLTCKRSGPKSLTLEEFAALPHVVDAGHVQMGEDGSARSVVDVLLGARGLRRRIALVLPTAAGLPHMVASTDLIATLPQRIATGLAAQADVNLIPCPLDIEVRPHMIWHARTNQDPVAGFVRQIVSEISTQS
jgi:DNA-binding transcriptional LysR family regulator